MKPFYDWLKEVATATSTDIGKPPPAVEDDDFGEKDDDEWRMQRLQEKFGKKMKAWSSNYKNPGVVKLHEAIIDTIFSFEPTIHMFFYGGADHPLSTKADTASITIRWGVYPLSEEVKNKWQFNWVHVKAELMRSDIWRVFNATPEQLFSLLDKGDVWYFVLAMASIQTPSDMIAIKLREEGLYYFGKNQRATLERVRSGILKAFPNAQNIRMKMEKPIEPPTNLYSNISIYIRVAYEFQL